MLTTLKVRACLFASVALAAALTSVQAAPAETFTYDDIFYQSDGNGHATVWGYSSSNPPVDLVIPSTVKHKYSVEVKDAETGNSRWEEHQETCSVTVILDCAFYKCSSLASVTIPSSVTRIRYRAFEGCSGLKSVTISEGVTSIEVRAFYECISLASVTVPSSVTSIGESAFYGCSGLKSVTIFEGVTSVGDWAFYGCTGLESVTIPSSVTSIGTAAFYGCNGLTSVTIPACVTKLSDTFLNGYSKIMNVVICEGVTSIGEEAFRGCSGLESVTIPSSVTSIGSHAFYNCSGLTEVSIPSSVTSVGEAAFALCEGLTSVTISEGVTSIGKEAFSMCGSLPSVTIPSSVTSIGESAFSDCSGLTRVTISEGVRSIGKKAFRDCSSLASVTIPSSMTSIGGEAFSDCSGLMSVTILPGLTSIEDAVFCYCSSLRTVTIPSSVTSIGVDAFSDCTSLPSVTIPSSVKTIGDGAFAFCGNLSSVQMSDRVEIFGPDAFAWCSKLQKLPMPSSLKSIGKSVFLNCRSATGVVRIPSGVTKISDAAFTGCHSLEGVEISSSVKNIGAAAFSYCDSIKNVNVPSGVAKIEDETFLGCTSLETIDLPSSVTVIGSRAFAGCVSLYEVEIPAGVTMLGDQAFADCFYEGVSPDHSDDGGGWCSARLMFQGAPPSASDRVGQSCIGYFLPEYATEWMSQVSNGYWHDVGIHCTDEYTVHFDANGGEGEMDDIVMPRGYKFVLPSSTFTCEGYTFGGWTYLANSTLADFQAGQETMGSLTSFDEITLYAFWEVDESQGQGDANDTFTLCFEPECYEYSGKMPKQIVVRREGQRVRKNAFSREGYVFSHWVVRLAKLGAAGQVERQWWPDICADEASLVNWRVPGGTVFYLHAMWRSVENPDNSLLTYSYDLQERTATVTGYKGDETTLFIPDVAFASETGIPVLSGDAGAVSYKVKGIGARAFYENKKLQMVRMPDTLLSIGDVAFYGCTALRSVSWHPSLKEIGTAAFQNCSSLSEIGMGACREAESLERIGDQAFERCALRTVVVPQTLKSLGYAAFRECGSLSDADIDGQDLALPAQCFVDCTSLRRVVLGNGITSLPKSTTKESGAFRGCQALQEVTLGEKISEIPDYGFYGLAALKSVTSKKESLVEIGRSAFVGCQALEKADLVPKYIWPSAFQGIKTRFSLDFRACIKIGEQAFAGSGLGGSCERIGNGMGWRGGVLNLPKIKSIYSDAFRGCENLRDVKFGPELEELCGAAFAKTGIERVEFMGERPPKTYSSSVLVFDGVSKDARGFFPDANGKGGHWREALDPKGKWQGLVFHWGGGEFGLPLTLMANSAAFKPSKAYVEIHRWADNKKAYADIRREDVKPIDTGSPVAGEPSVWNWNCCDLCFNRPGVYYVYFGYKNGEWRAESGSQDIEVTEDDVTKNRLGRRLVVRYVSVEQGKRIIHTLDDEIAEPRAKDSDNDGYPDLVEVKSPFTSSVSGTFTWTAALEDEEGNFITTATGTMALNVGDNDVAFAFDGEKVRAHGACGGYRVNCIVFSNGTEEIAVNEELTVAALSFDDWGEEPTPAALVRQVVLDGNGGSCPVPTVDLALGQPYGELPPATRAGYAFDGWYTAATGGEKIAAEDLFQSRVDRLYAHWRRGAEDGVYQKEVGGVTWTYVVKNCQATVGGPDDAQRLAVDSGASGSLVIPAAFDNCPVTAIAPAAFKDCAQLAAVSVPASVRVIPEQAFMGCTALESVVLAEGLVEIGISAFENCPALKALTIPATVVRIGGRAFYGCRGLQRLVFPSSVREIGSEAFVGLRWFMEYEFEGLPPEVEDDTFGNGGLFSWSKKHEDVWQSLSAQGVWENLEVHGLNLRFSASRTKTQTVKGLKWRYTVKDGEASVGGYDESDDSLVAIPRETSGKVVIPSTLGGYPVTTIGYEAFYQCERLTEIVVPKGVRTIGYGAFAYCEQVKKVVLPASLRSIGEFAFACCSELRNIELPANLVAIGPEAFRWSALTEVSLPAKVAYVSPSAFADCGDLFSFKVAKGNKSYKVVKDLLLTANGEELVGISRGLRVLNVPEGVKKIENWVGRGIDILEEIRLPASVSRFDSSAFSPCPSLQAYVVDGENKTYKSVDGFLLTKDGTRLVAGPMGKETVVLPSGILVVGKGALARSEAKSIRLNEELVSIEEEGLDACFLKTLTIPASVQSIGEYGLPTGYFLNEIVFEGEPPSECGMTYWYDCSGKYFSAHAAAWRKVLGGKTGNWNGLPMSQASSPSGVRTYAVTFDCGVHGQWVEPGAKSQLVSAGSAATAPAVEAKPGWRFVGWDKAFDAVQSDLLVTAQYEPLVYAISYVGTKGAVNRNPTTYTPAAGVTFAPLSETAGYAFAGWSPKAIAKGAFGDVTVTAQWKKITKAKVSVGSFGAVSGTKVSVSAKSAKPKASVTFKATPAKAKGKREASFFAGWYADADGIELVSMKNPLKYKVPAVSSVKLYARFEKVKDYLPTIHCEATYALTPGVPFAASVGATSPFAGAIAVSVKGLPSGLKYKGGTIGGTPKAFSKSVTATVTAKNATGTVKKKIVFTSVNPGFVVWAIAQAAGSESVYVGPKAQLTPYVGVPFEMALASAPGLSGRDDYEASAVTVTGLKNGLSFNAKKGLISGVATKTGKQTVKATFKNKWGWTESFSFTISPQSLPEWLVGSYVGLGSYGSADGAVQLTVGAGGKISGKIVAGGKSYSFSAKSFAGSTGLGGETVFTVKAKVNKKYTATFTFATADGVIGCVTASSANGEVALEAWQDAWARKDVYLPPYANGTVKFTSADLEALGVAVKSGDSLAVKFSSKGAVKVTGKLGGKTLSASAKVVMTEVLEDGKAAAGEVVVPYGARAAVLPFVWSAGQKPEVEESLSE